MAPIREDKPLWSAVPDAVRREAERLLGSPVVTARRAFGGYGPSATFSLTLSDGRRAFFKGVYPLPEGSAVRWRHDEEERVYAEIGQLIRPWAPAYYGTIQNAGWDVLLIEAVPGVRVPPWTDDRARRAFRSYARFHASTFGVSLPGWLPRDNHVDFASFWRNLAADDEGLARIAAACVGDGAQTAARTWLDAHCARLIAAESVLLDADPSRFALLHFDTRSDNIRLDGDLLRIFDWPDASAGPFEFDLVAFAQSVINEGGPSAEDTLGWYSDVLAVDEDLVTASITGIAGYFADRGTLPDLPGLPRLRPHQRRQLKVSLPWAARRLSLPEPDWLEGMAD